VERGGDSENCVCVFFVWKRIHFVAFVLGAGDLESRTVDCVEHGSCTQQLSPPFEDLYWLNSTYARSKQRQTTRHKSTATEDQGTHSSLVWNVEYPIIYTS
jgi:hypothetical protein